MKTLVLKGQILEQSGFFLATVESLPLVSRGDTAFEAEDGLAKEFRNWVQRCEERGNLEVSLSNAGYPDVDDETEIHLIFVDEDAQQE
jgi:hypothetical protein